MHRLDTVIFFDAELFYKEHISWIKDSSGKKVGECFSLKSSSNPLYYFALDSSSEEFTVKGMVG